MLFGTIRVAVAAMKRVEIPRLVRRMNRHARKARLLEIEDPRTFNGLNQCGHFALTSALRLQPFSPPGSIQRIPAPVRPTRLAAPAAGRRASAAARPATAPSSRR